MGRPAQVHRNSATGFGQVLHQSQTPAQFRDVLHALAVYRGDAPGPAKTMREILGKEDAGEPPASEGVDVEGCPGLFAADADDY